jgi:hypothetical protein
MHPPLSIDQTKTLCRTLFELSGFNSKAGSSAVPET